MRWWALRRSSLLCKSFSEKILWRIIKRTKSVKWYQVTLTEGIQISCDNKVIVKSCCKHRYAFEFTSKCRVVICFSWLDQLLLIYSCLNKSGTQMSLAKIWFDWNCVYMGKFIRKTTIHTRVYWEPFEDWKIIKFCTVFWELWFDDRKKK